jgi:hypothetical protein
VNKVPWIMFGPERSEVSEQVRNHTVRNEVIYIGLRICRLCEHTAAQPAIFNTLLSDVISIGIRLQLIIEKK